MNRKNIRQRAQILACLVEGNSIRSTVRMTGAAKNTVVKLLADVGSACLDYQDKTLVNLPCKRIQCDEIWSFCYSKQKNVPEEKQGQFGFGDVWTWTAICADTKIVPCWQVGKRDSETAAEFIHSLASRLKNRVQLTTDGHKAYLEAVEESFGADIGYAMLVKMYGEDSKAEKRYSPSQFVSATKVTVQGKPDEKHVSTSYVERQNLTMRMSMRRFTRLTNAFSKKVENLAHAVSLHFMYYNFARIHKTLRVTPAMEAGISDHVWELEEIAALADSN
ncbi:MAG: DDE-type integrase/transposase/recombinase [Nitrospirae bacterium]|nr:DDE-type integrase/transposase/recombinase [Nitrospirota bacterium]